MVKQISTLPLVYPVAYCNNILKAVFSLCLAVWGFYDFNMGNLYGMQTGKKSSVLSLFIIATNEKSFYIRGNFDLPKVSGGKFKMITWVMGQ